MPHVIVKLWPGRSDSDKMRMAAAIVQELTRDGQTGEESVSVAFEEVSARDWNEKVYKPDILGKPDSLYKQPGY